MATKKVFAIHPGEILREEFMKPLGLTAYQLAKELHVSIPRVSDIVRERRAVTADTALRLGRYFGTDAQTWMNLQADTTSASPGAKRILAACAHGRRRRLRD